MLYAPRTIAFITEVFHPVLQPDPAPIQRVHNHLFQESDPAYGSFAVTHNGAVLSNPVTRPGAVSSATFLPDRIQFREELTGMTVDEFAQRVRRIVELVTQHIDIQVFTAQQVTIRTLVNPRNFNDSREFLCRGMFGFSDEIDVFERAPQLYGIRMVFPPDEQNPNAYSLRIESFSQDVRSIFIENQANYAPILVARGLDALVGNVDNAYQFLVDRALDFMANFDVRQEV